MRRWLLAGLLCISVAGAAWAGDFTREEIAIMHNAGVKMALVGESKAYVIPLDIAPDRLVKTEVLNFSGNSVVTVPDWLAKFTQVRQLDLSNAGIKAESALLNALGSMPSLEILDLSGNRLFASGGSSLAAVWGKLPGLRHLNLANTGGSVSDYGSMAALTQLNKLDLSGASLSSDLSGLGLKSLPLERLNLAKSGVSGAPLSALPTATLGELDLSGNSAMTIEAEYGGMFAFPKLAKLSIDDNTTVPEGLRKNIRDRDPAFKAAMAESNKRYTLNSNGTVTDTKTSLMWKQCSEGQSGDRCSGDAAKYKWDDAMSKFRSGVSFAGYSDWRMPTREELQTLVYCSTGTSTLVRSDATSCGGNYQSPTINQTAFPNTALSWHWSSTEKDMYAWGVNFDYGLNSLGHRNNVSHVRLVRSGQ
ncbi:MAG: hypothetical protein RI964_2616 [Pseudomonadota bacterium]|jgi:hypothetical protein